MLISYLAGQKYYPIDYPVKDILVYFFLAAFIFYWMTVTNEHFTLWAALLINTGWLLCFVIYIIRKDLPLSELPFVGKYFRKK